jgi:hypothetical protein
LAKQADWAFAKGYLLLYVGYVGGCIVLLSTQDSTTAVVYGISVFVLFSAVIVCTMARSLRVQKAQRQKVARQLAATHDSENAGERQAAVLRAFKLFDSDRSGSLEWEETTELLRALYPSLRASVEEDVFYQIEAHLGLNPEAGVPCPRVVRSFSCAPVFIELTSGSPSVLSMRNEQGA